MFTGIIKELGRVKDILNINKGKRIEIKSEKISKDLEKGMSAAINGCCLTVVDVNENSLFFDVVQETFDLTNFENLYKGEPVNIEPALSITDRLDGHIVQGHIDGVGTIIKKKHIEDGSFEITVASPESLMRYIVKKGSIAVDGVSLTVTQVSENSFSFVVIPHTALLTSLGSKGEGSLVNLETDIMARQLEKLYQQSACKEA